MRNKTDTIAQDVFQMGRLDDIQYLLNIKNGVGVMSITPCPLCHIVNRSFVLLSAGVI